MRAILCPPVCCAAFRGIIAQESEVRSQNSEFRIQKAGRMIERRSQESEVRTHLVWMMSGGREQLSHTCGVGEDFFLMPCEAPLPLGRGVGVRA
ncbi:hypothetical protein HC891_24630 [Candidatus Gracilibacteria bacterium]|nr:hypothetical protein [Candidatus Gracilibacteria bacterium]